MNIYIYISTINKLLKANFPTPSDYTIFQSYALLHYFFTDFEYADLITSVASTDKILHTDR